jgi:hypothetical protein
VYKAVGRTTTVTDPQHETRLNDLAQMIIGAGNLLLVNQAPWLTDPTLALSETVLVSLPASFAATIVDHMS